MSVTITGSIGVFGLAPTFEKTLDKVQIGHGSVGTTWLANAEKLTGPLDPRLESVLTQSVARTYKDFTKLVSQSRSLPINQVLAVAQGRVWTGQQALDRHLVDHLGDFNAAIDRARVLAKLPQNANYVIANSQAEDVSSLLRGSLRKWTVPLSALGLDTLLSNVQQFNLTEPGLYAHSLVRCQP